MLLTGVKYRLLNTEMWWYLTLISLSVQFVFHVQVSSYIDCKSPLSSCALLGPSLAICGDADGVLTTLDLRNPKLDIHV